ncbi:MAG: class I SAM-dependent methyltransferase [Candidatus Omnitrophica bacterium]|nr:class I SAM-dependent methyltransferase [Candidatus Omnitrophota bacterium]
MKRRQQIKFLRLFLETYWNDPGLAFWRAKEAALISQASFLFPMLDLGCADGLFLSTLAQGKAIKDGEVVGIDLRQEVLKVSSRIKLYKTVICGDISKLPFMNRSFNSVLSNCVLEHIQPLEQTLSELSRVASKGSQLIFTVPDKLFGENLLPVRLARLFGFKKLAQKHKDAVNRDLMHINCYDKNWWEDKLFASGFRMKYCEPYLSNYELLIWYLFFYAARIKINRFNLAGILNYSVGHSGNLLGRLLKEMIIFVSFVIFALSLGGRRTKGNALFIVGEKL